MDKDTYDRLTRQYAELAAQVAALDERAMTRWPKGWPSHLVNAAQEAADAVGSLNDLLYAEKDEPEHWTVRAGVPLPDFCAYVRVCVAQYALLVGPEFEPVAGA